MDKIIIANWKMNPKTPREALDLARAFDEPNIVIAPPFTFLEEIKAVLKRASLGAQDLFFEESGAFTGEVSASQLASLGVSYVIVGHSERRRLGDTNEIVAKKALAALRNGLIPIICIGETRAERISGKSKEAVSRQLIGALSAVGHESSHRWRGSPRAAVISHKLLIAYEPVWAISTEPGAEPDTPENAVQMIRFIKTLVSSSYSLVSSFIYGGSVNSKNAESFLKEKEIEGALVGGASLKKEEFRRIIDIANRH